MRLWFDKSDGKTVYGVFNDQRFYSRECEETYEGEHADVENARTFVETFSNWAMANYRARNEGTEQIPLPEQLRSFQFEYKEVTDETEAYPDPEEG